MKESKWVIPYSGMVITESVTFWPGVYNFFQKEGILIRGENITVDGSGSVLIGGKGTSVTTDDSNTKEFSYGYGNRKDQGLCYYGTGITLDAAKGVIVKGITVKGFERGLYLDRSEDCCINNCDFSYNYHNPNWGWDEHDNLGGMILNSSHRNEIAYNKANNVWSALVLYDSNHNYVHHNDCSHTSNVGLRMWLSSYNTIENNDFSWGLRKKPDEIHARDSSCVLIESASCHNVLKRNDMRYGGDGLFIRSLNNMMSMHNLFEENDASFANNNAIEAWDAFNTYIRNKANYSSYGFWLGGSDHTILIENEVIGNGTVFENAPESFGNAGIAVVNGSGNDFYLERNLIKDNHGPGIAIRHKADDPSRNWIIKENIIHGNKNDSRGNHGHGIYINHGVNMHLIGNEINENEGKEIFLEEDTSYINIHQESMEIEKLEMKELNNIFCQGQSAVLELPEGYENYEVHTNEGMVYRTRKPELVFKRQGRYHIFANALKESKIATGEATVYVLPQGKNLKFQEKYPLSFVFKEQEKSVHAASCEPIACEQEDYLYLLYRYENDFIDWNKEVCAPIIRLKDSEGKTINVCPKRAILVENCGKANEAKYQWEILTVPLKKNKDFKVEWEKGFSGIVTELEWEFETPVKSNGKFVLGGGCIAREINPPNTDVVLSNELTVHQISTRIHSGHQKIFIGENGYQYGSTRRWESTKEGEQAVVQLDFQARLPVKGISLKFYGDQREVFLPEKVTVENLAGEILSVVHHLQDNTLMILLKEKLHTGLVLRFHKKDGEKIGIFEFRILQSKLEGVKIQSDCMQEELELKEAVVKLNVEMKSGDESITDLSYGLFQGNLQRGNCLYEGKIPYSKVPMGRELRLLFPGIKLRGKESYYLLLWQQSLSESISKGAYYRWVGAGISEMDGSYGYLNESGIINQGQTGWGKNYLLIKGDKRIIDNRTDCEGLGNRFGIKEMEKLFQQFTIPSVQEDIIKPNYLLDTGIRLEKNQVRELIIEWKGMRKMSLCLKDGEGVTALVGDRIISPIDGEIILPPLGSGVHKIQIRSQKEDKVICIFER